MELDFELILYIIFIAVALLSRFLKKKKRPENISQNEESEPQQKPITFEDLLKEFTQTGEEKEPTVREAPPKEQIEFKDPIPDDAEVNEIYQQSLMAAKNVGEPSQKRERPVFEHFEAFEQVETENKIADGVREMLKNPQNAAQAIVLSEILNRKY